MNIVDLEIRLDELRIRSADLRQFDINAVKVVIAVPEESFEPGAGPAADVEHRCLLVQWRQVSHERFMEARYRFFPQRFHLRRSDSLQDAVLSRRRLASSPARFLRP